MPSLCFRNCSIPIFPFCCVPFPWDAMDSNIPPRCALSQGLPQQTGTSRFNHLSFSYSSSHPQAGTTVSTRALHQKLQKPQGNYSKSPLTTHCEYLYNWKCDTKKYWAKATKIPTGEGTGRELRFSRETPSKIFFPPGRVKAVPGPSALPSSHLRNNKSLALSPIFALLTPNLH